MLAITPTTFGGYPSLTANAWSHLGFAFTVASTKYLYDGDTITLNGGTQGGQVSDTLTLIDIAANLWHVEGQMRTPTGANPATPFSEAVS